MEDCEGTNGSTFVNVKSCSNCGTTSSGLAGSRWRHNSSGDILCNACYQYHNRNKTNRPAKLWAATASNTTDQAIQKAPQPKQKLNTGTRTGWVQERCVPCVWRGRACNGEEPCDTCTAAFDNGLNWTCHYDPTFARPTGGMPDMYKSKPSNQSVNPTGKNTRKVTKPSLIVKLPLPGQYQLPSPEKSIMAAPISMLLPEELQKFPITPESAVKSNDTHGFSTVRGLVQSLRDDIQIINDIISSSPPGQEFLRVAVEKKILMLARNLRNPVLAGYLEAEQEIQVSMAGGDKEWAMEENLKNCLAVGDWKGELVD